MGATAAAVLLEASYLLIACFALAIMLGWRYRLFSVLFAFTYPYTFLVEKSYYLNHDYLFLMLGFVMMCMPAERMFSLDARRSPQKYPREVPRWTTLLFCVLMGVVYFYGGLAKLQPDWLEARPLKLWLSAKTPLSSFK